MDAVVIGGGVIGLSVAWRAARGGPERRRRRPGSRLGRLSLRGRDDRPDQRGGVRRGRGRPAEPRFRRRATRRSSPRSRPNSGLAAGYRQCGTLHVAVDADEHAALERGYQHRRSSWASRCVGCPPRETRELEPGLAPSIRSGMLVELDHMVDPRALTAALLAACAGHGVEIHRGRGSRSSPRPEGWSASVIDGDERIDAHRRVVLAAGCWSGAVDGVPAEDVPTGSTGEGPDPPASRRRPR